MDGFDEDTLDFGSDDSGWGDDSGFDFDSISGIDDNSQGSQIDSNRLSNAFGDANNDYADVPDTAGAGGNQAGTKKSAIVAIVVGVIAVSIILVVATKAGRKHVEKQNNSSSNSQVMSTNNAQPSDSGQTVRYVSDELDLDWIEITDHESVEFEDEYKEFQFTITDIKHYARAVDSQNNLVVKTVLTGAISGLTGSYTIEVPYEKGVLLSTDSDSFTVYVKVGTYNGKRVVGDIKY